MSQKVLIVADLSAGEMLDDRYRILDRLGGGGMGTVYRAFDTRASRDCAIKVLHPRVSGESGILRFKREFRAASRLSHPNCIKVFELGCADRQWYFAMEFVDGGSLEKYRGGLPEVVTGLTLQILAALDHLHGKQIVHRDVKPQNILLIGSEPGSPLLPQVKLTDFGIVKVAGLGEEIGVGSLAGSLPYLSPEQGEENPVDARSDLYSVGVVLYELLTGRLPIEASVEEARKRGPSQAWIAAHRSMPPVPLSQAAPRLPARLGEIVGRLLEKDPSRRYPTAAMVHDDLSEWIASTGRSVVLPAAPPLERHPYLAVPRLVGRAQETARIQRILELRLGGATAGEAPPLVMVSGEAGLGKSRLVNEIAARGLKLGALRLASTCRQERGGAFEALQPLIRLIGAPGDATAALEATIGSTGGASSASGASSTSSRPTRVSNGGHRATGGALALGATTPAASDAPRSSSASSAGSSPLSAPTAVALTIPAASGAAPITGDAGSGPSVEEGESLRWRFQRSIADGLLTLCSNTPCLVLIEDVHWADAATLEFLGFLLRTLVAAQRAGHSARIVFVLTHRPTPEHAALAALQRVGEELHALETVELPQFDGNTAAQFVASMLMTPVDDQLIAFTARLLLQARGNPLFLGQILHTLLQSGRIQRAGRGWNLDATILDAVQLPSTIRDAIGDRAARFGPATHQAVAAAAVVGRRFDLPTLEAVCELDQSTLLDCLDEAIRSDFLAEEAEGGYQFTHDRFREAIYDRLPDAQRAALHRRAALDSEKRFGADPERAAERAYHLAAAGEFAAAFTQSKRAAQHAMSTYAFARAADLFANAREEAARAGLAVPVALVEDHGDACLHAGRYDSAAVAFQDALARITDPLARTEVLRKTAEVEHRRGNTPRAAELNEQVLRELGVRVPGTGLSLYLSLLLYAVLFLRHLIFPRKLEARTGKRDRALETAARVCIRLTETFYFMNFFRAAYYLLAGIVYSERIGPGDELCVACSQAGFIIGEWGFYKLGRRYLDRSRTVGEMAASPVEQAWEAILRAFYFTTIGDTASQIEESRRSMQILRDCKEQLRMRQALYVWAEGPLLTGDLAEAQRLASELTRMAYDVSDERGLGWGTGLLGHVKLRRRELEAAILQLQEACAHSERGGDLAWWLVWNGRLAQALAFAGRYDQAVEVAHLAVLRELPTHIRNPTQALDGLFLQAAALQLKHRGKVDAAVRRTVKRVRRWRRHYAHCITASRPSFLAGEGAWLIASGRLDAGRKRIERAIAEATQRGWLGELLDVHQLAALILPDDEAAKHRREGDRLHESLGTGTPLPTYPSGPLERFDSRP